jgi:uncharacterized membrane protein
MLTSPNASGSSQLDRDDAIKWIVVAVLVFAALMAILVTRQLSRPLDNLVTKQVCSAYGEAVGRDVLSYERSNRMSLANRSNGSCLLAPAEGGGENLQVSIPDAHPGAIYEATKLMLFILQLGAASAAVRLLADPLLDRFVRNVGSGPDPDRTTAGPAH